MPIEFNLESRLGGFSVSYAEKGEIVRVLTRELVGPGDSTHLVDRLEQLQASIFNKIPNLPPPSVIDHLVVLIRKDLSGTAYVNELPITARVRVTRAVRAGEPLVLGDFSEVSEVNLGIEVPEDAAVVVVRTFSWKRALYFDFGPLADDDRVRDVPLEQALAQQAMLLLDLVPATGGEPSETTTPTEFMAEGYEELCRLLNEMCTEEAAYQELLESHPWMLGAQYSVVERHTKLDDSRIPDFTAVRVYDGNRDIFELKQPFLRLFKDNGGPNANFNDAWNQGEDYLTFVQRQRVYLRQEKGLEFNNARCILILGHALSRSEIRRIRAKEGQAMAISVLTYDELKSTARHVLNLVLAAAEPIQPQWLTAASASDVEHG